MVLTVGTVRLTDPSVGPDGTAGWLVITVGWVGAPGLLDTLGIPAVPAAPETPVTPEGLETATELAIPETLGCVDGPEEPETETLDMPVTPVAPETPVTPAVLETPVIIPVTPEILVTLETLGCVDAPETLGIPVIPEIPEALVALEALDCVELAPAGH